MSILLTLPAPAVLAIAVAPPPRYAEGQVWEYRTRKGDEESRLKIQKIAPLPGARDRMPIYHITIVRVELGPNAWSGVISNAPVSKESLDESVTRLSSSRADFGDAKEGIEEWRRANGGVFTLSVAEIVGVIADAAAAGTAATD